MPKLKKLNVPLRGLGPLVGKTPQASFGAVLNFFLKHRGLGVILKFSKIEMRREFAEFRMREADRKLLLLDLGDNSRSSNYSF